MNLLEGGKGGWGREGGEGTEGGWGGDVGERGREGEGERGRVGGRGGGEGGWGRGGEWRDDGYSLLNLSQKYTQPQNNCNKRFFDGFVLYYMSFVTLQNFTTKI